MYNFFSIFNVLKNYFNMIITMHTVIIVVSTFS